MMGGKSRKLGKVSKELIKKLKASGLKKVGTKAEKSPEDKPTKDFDYEGARG